MAHLICEKHRKRSMFFPNRLGEIIVRHRNNGEKCDLPIGFADKRAAKLALVRGNATVLLLKPLGRV